MAQKLRSERDISQRIKLRELYIVSAVVHHGSMAKAAEQIAMSQPAVSDAIAKCEANSRRTASRPQPTGSHTDSLCACSPQAWRRYLR